MRRLSILFALALSCAPPSPRADTAQVKIVRCVRSWGEARYGAYGYDHVVHVANDCDDDVICDVSTDVDPRPIRVQVATKKRRAVVTRKGSPSRKFTPRVSCWFAD